ncbi:cysteine proteinase [Basidiobolus meristosporus CBS 931.73]|uniref:ubiquitinyl hydrolase 1 n=1 Tax=Basidiobolus meristosporus CBS 931.73 TaxID=1314790 RepID=A0A1Y1XVF1_9FUNG|nr:cysteine proteinase [Basidiobolus meristosporus CBS 931.73]|eukprot:ORX89655.1 cysteine proteinase [Basidiobolus meristosporus CBS 931.73]
MANIKRGDQSSWVYDASLETEDKITQDHLIKFYGLSNTTARPYCPNRYSSKCFTEKKTRCTNSRCKDNPNCLNHLGQEFWEREDAFEKYCQANGLSVDLAEVRTRMEGSPVGLKNLGATCYVNSLLQVWFHNLHIRKGIYEFQHHEERNPICYQLQRAFAFLEHGNQDTYDPIHFIEALELNADEEQDVQEFCKLFTSLLNSVFETQERANLRNLFKDQFEGEYEYGTKCSKCKNVSHRRETFHELELHIKDNTSLEQCIERFLKPETMKGDDQYFCSECESKQNATRTTRINKLPNVLNVQLMRFVYDIKTCTKKKNNARIKFPRTLSACMLQTPLQKKRKGTSTEDSKGIIPDHKRKRSVGDDLCSIDGHASQQKVISKSVKGKDDAGMQIDEFVDLPNNQTTSTLTEDVVSVATSGEGTEHKARMVCTKGSADGPTSDNSGLKSLKSPTSGRRESIRIQNQITTNAANNASGDIEVRTVVLEHSVSSEQTATETPNAAVTPRRRRRKGAQTRSPLTTPKLNDEVIPPAEPTNGSTTSHSKKRRKKQPKEAGVDTLAEPTTEMCSEIDENGSSEENDTDDVYDLTAVLTHEGPSAYSGHYTAYVFDTGKQCWFKFDDEKVTNEGPVLNLQTCQDSKPKKKKSVSSESSEKVKTEEIEPEHIENGDHHCSSRDAYMLIYTKRTLDQPQMVRPMDTIMQEIEQANRLMHKQAHAQNESLFSAREQFDRERESRRAIYSTWDVVEENGASYFFPKSFLQDWINGPLYQSEESKSSSSGSVPPAVPVLACDHGNLSPYQMKLVKRVNKACGEMITQQHPGWDEVFSLDQLCSKCALEFLKEKRYQAQHSKDVQEFEKAMKVKSPEQYLISKAWVKEWCKKTPGFDWEDISSDPFPEHEAYGLDVRCTHGGVSLDLSNCRPITKKAMEVLVKLFPNYQPPDESTSQCEKCVKEQENGRSSSARALKEVEEERMQCKYLVTQGRKDLATLSEPTYFVIDNAFIQEWRSFVRNPESKLRPEAFDNSFLFCQHGRLHYDFSDPVDQPVLNKLSFLTSPEWLLFKSHYAGGPEVQLKKPIIEDQVIYETIPGVCPECVVSRRLDFQEAVVHICRKEKSEQSEVSAEGKKKRTARGTRVSQRSKSNVRARITVRKDDTVKDIKVKIMDKLNISPLYQRLYFLDHELVNNDVSIRELGMLPNSQIYLSEIEPVKEEEEIWEDQASKGEETGFKGTSLLA